MAPRSEMQVGQKLLGIVKTSNPDDLLAVGLREEMYAVMRRLPLGRLNRDGDYRYDLVYVVYAGNGMYELGRRASWILE